MLIAREESIYRGLAAASGGWTAWRDFVVDSTEPEGDVREMLANEGIRLAMPTGTTFENDGPLVFPGGLVHFENSESPASSDRTGLTIAPRCAAIEADYRRTHDVWELPKPDIWLGHHTE